jgi:hypothetical protein
MFLRIRFFLFAFVAGLLGQLFAPRATEPREPAPAPRGAAATEITLLPLTPIETYLPRGEGTGDQSIKGNELVFLVSWRGSTGASPQKLLAFLTGVTNHTGVNINSGDTTDPDFVFDAVLNGAWDLPNDISTVYNGRNDVAMSTADPVEQNTTVQIIVSSYDFGGEGKLRVETEDGLSFSEISFPLDTDKDTLPNAWETGKKYWTADGQHLPYLIGSTISPGITAATDGKSDQDRDDRAAAVHSQLGDGFTAYEEYRGATVMGVAGRFEEHSTDGPANGGFSGDRGGPDVKDLFVYDSQYDDAGAKKDIFRKGNTYLSDYKLIWHKIKIGEMRSKKGLAGEVNFNGGFTAQKAVWVADVRLGGQDRNLLGFSSLSVKDGAKVKLDVTDIKALSDKVGAAPGFESILDWHVAHELGHKLSLEHAVSHRTWIAQTAANAVNYLTAQARNSIQFWMPITSVGTARNDLEIIMGFEKRAPRVTQRTQNGPQIQIHGAAHSSDVLIVDVGTAIQNPETRTLDLEGHFGYLLDPVIELESLQALLEPEKDRKNILIKH